MRTTQDYLDYLRKIQDLTYHKKLCYSLNHTMTTPRPGCEEQYAQASEECLLVEELIELVSRRDGVKRAQANNQNRHNPVGIFIECPYSCSSRKIARRRWATRILPTPLSSIASGW